MEKNIEAGLKKIALAAGGLALKFVSPGTTGVPDRILLLPGGRIVFIEFKDTGKKLRLLQEYRKKQFEELGFDVRVIDRKEMLEALGDEIRPA